MHERLDAIIIGGGPAGLSAALYLGRARKRVLVIDAGSPRHAVSDGVHNFLTREGMPPAELRRVAWEQMAPFATVARVEARVASLDDVDGDWVATSTDGARWRARAALLAVGVIDEHPAIPGFEARWGHSIHHCPYCHGWEVRDLPLGVVASGDGAAHMAPLLKGWSADVALFTNGAPVDDALRAELAAREVPIRTGRIVGLEGEGVDLSHVVLEGGERVARRGLFVVSGQRQVPLVEALGLATSELGYLVVDQMQQTSRPRLWAAGDCTSRMQQVLFAAAQGGVAGATMNAVLTVGG